MISIIVCIAQNRAIGFENKLLYWLPNDLKRFKQLTTGHTIIMGRRTFESFPKGALPNRRNVVLSRQTDAHFEGAEHFPTLEEALTSCKPDEEIFILGGSTVYEQAMPFANQLLVTLVDDTPDKADAFFPIIDPCIWDIKKREKHDTDEKHAFTYTFIDYSRKLHAQSIR